MLINTKSVIVGKLVVYGVESQTVLSISSSRSKSYVHQKEPMSHAIRQT